MKLNEALETLNAAGFVCESLDEIELSPEEQDTILKAIKSRYTRVKSTKSKGIRIDHLGEPMWLRIWKNAKNTYKYAIDYVTPDGMLNNQLGINGMAKSIRSLLNKIDDTILDIADENSSMSH
jgi:hypothetical protein